MFRPRRFRILTIPGAIVLILSLSTLMFLTSLNSAHAETIPSWGTTTHYPSNVELESCGVSGGYIYCVGGENGASWLKSVEYGAISGAGVTSWTATTDYSYNDGFGDTGMGGGSCVISGGYIYCVGGAAGAAYYAELSASGGFVANWSAITSYPQNVGDSQVSSESCVTSSGYLYCMGGFNGHTNNIETYYALVGASGITGGWLQTADYNGLSGQSCDSSGTDIFCVGGAFVSGAVQNVVYSASISSLSTTATGVGCVASSFPVGGNTSCTATVTGSSGSINGETVTWTQTGGTGTVSFSGGGTCTISGTSCSVTVTGTGAGSATVQASYPGDSGNDPSMGSSPP